MALDPRYMALFPLQEIIFDKDLNVPLAAGTVQFFVDPNNVVPKDVYQLVGDGMGNYSYVNLGSELTLSGIGTFVDHSGNNIIPYLWVYEGSPTDVPVSTIPQLYFIVVTSSTGVFQFDMPAWPPQAQGNGLAPAIPTGTTGNIIQNGQFVQIDFPASATQSSPFVISTTGTNTATEIAPDWSLVTNGTGTVSVYRQAISDTTAPSTGNPAYALGIAASTGYSLPIILRQRILAPRIFSNSLVSGTFIAESFTGTVYTLTMSYVPSGTQTPQIICSGNTPTTLFGVIANSTAVTITPNAAGTAPSSYVDITITIPVGAQVLISNIQLCGVSASNEAVPYLQNTPEQEINGLFHYYNPKLMFKPIPSLLTGWDFPLNPAQLGTTLAQPCSTVAFSTTPGYIWDQTIGASAVSTVNVQRGSNPSGVFAATTTVNTEAFYLLQYLSGASAIETALSRLSVNISAWDTAGSVVANVYLFNGNASSTIPTLPTTIGTIAANGVFTLTASNWVAIPQGGGNSNTGLLPSQNGDIGFSGWDPTSFYGLTNNFAIVVTFAVPTSGTSTLINSISCVPGDIPTRPAPQTADEVLRECQFYYEKSYPLQIPKATATVNNSVMQIQSSLSQVGLSTVASFASPWNVTYRVGKRTTPNVTHWSIAGTVNDVTAYLWYLNNAGIPAFTTIGPTDKLRSTFWAVDDANVNVINFIPVSATNLLSNNNSNTTNAFCSAAIQFQYEADARLGIVA